MDAVVPETIPAPSADNPGVGALKLSMDSTEDSCIYFDPKTGDRYVIPRAQALTVVLTEEGIRKFGRLFSYTGQRQVSLGPLWD